MPYAKTSDLPDSVRSNLPGHAQEIYKEAFNSAWDHYRHKSERRDPNDSREEVSHRVAWSAVEKVYAKQGGKWRKK